MLRLSNRFVEPACVPKKTLLFAGEGSGMMSAPSPKHGGSKLRAFDRRTGKTLWELELPGRQSGNPIDLRHR